MEISTKAYSATCAPTDLGYFTLSTLDPPQKKDHLGQVFTLEGDSKEDIQAVWQARRLVLFTKIDGESLFIIHEKWMGRDWNIIEGKSSSIIYSVDDESIKDKADHVAFSFLIKGIKQQNYSDLKAKLVVWHEKSYALVYKMIYDEELE